MLCLTCHSANTLDYPSEINIHFPGMQGLNIPTVLVFPKLLVCLDCGFVEFEIPERELRVLKEGARAAA